MAAEMTKVGAAAGSPASPAVEITEASAEVTAGSVAITDAATGSGSPVFKARAA
jgi:hypothetical protein